MASRRERGKLGLTSVLALTPILTLALATDARAAALSTPVGVIGIESDDAEALAEGLTASLESGIDRLPGWRKAHVRESLSTLSFAFQCPSRPDPACLERMAQHLGLDSIIWGSLRRVAEGRFDASVHLWRRRGPGSDYVARILASSAPTTDPVVAAQGLACAKNLLAPVLSRLNVQFAALGAPAFLRVDGVNRGNFVDGVVRLELAPGPHRVEAVQGILVVAGRELDVRGDEDGEVTLEAPGGSAAAAVGGFGAGPGGVLGAGPLPGAGALPGPGPDEHSWKSYAAYGSLGVGGALGIAAIVEAVKFSNSKTDLEGSLARVPSAVTDVCATDAVPNAVDACRSYQSAQTSRLLGFVFGAVSVVAIGGGAALLWQATHEQKTADRNRIGFTPRTGGGEMTFTTPLD